MAVAAKRTRTYAASRWGWRIALVPLVVAALFAAAIAALDVAFDARALPGVTVAGVDVGTLPANEMRGRLESEIAQPWADSGVLVHGPDGLVWSTTNGALGIAPEMDRAIAEALAYGHVGSLPQRVAAWMEALRGHVAVPFATRAEGTAVDEWVGQIARSVDRSARDGAIVATYSGIEVTPAVIGRTVDRGALRGALLAPDTMGDRSIAVAVHETYPSVDPSGIRDAAAKAIAATTALRIGAGNGSVSEDAAGLASLLIIEKVAGTPGDLDAIPAGATAPGTRYIYTTRLDEARVAQWVTRVAALLDHPAKNATYAVRPDGTLAVVPAVDGVVIDRAQLLAATMNRLFTPVAAPREITPSFVVDPASFTTELAQRYVGQMTPISSFTTTYPVSATRHANITTGALQFDELVLAPGESFSFWDRLGPVTVERGYAYAGAIINNRSDENVIGGGLCQVSTTLFNAVARAGYEVLERHAHGYYIDRYPLGFDAAVFEPGVDFRWRNDTPYPVLIRAYPYDAALRFDLISVPNGRRVVIGDAVQWNLVSPAPDQPADPAYPPGAVVQGRDVSRTWTVWEGDQILRSVAFASHYAPVWGGPAR